MTPDFWLGVLVALVISVTANLITPMTRTALLALLVRLGNTFKALGTWGLRRSLVNSEKELRQLDDFSSNPGSFAATAMNVLSLNLVVVWAVVITLGIAAFGGWVPGREASHGFFGLLGASTSIFGQLLVTQATAEHLQTYESYRPKLLKRIELLKLAIGARSEG